LTHRRSPQVQNQPIDFNPPMDFAGDDGSEHFCSLVERKYDSAHSGYHEAIEDEYGGAFIEVLRLRK